MSELYQKYYDNALTNVWDHVDDIKYKRLIYKIYKSSFVPGMFLLMTRNTICVLYKEPTKRSIVSIIELHTKYPLNDLVQGTEMLEVAEQFLQEQYTIDLTLRWVCRKVMFARWRQDIIKNTQMTIESHEYNGCIVAEKKIISQTK